MQKGSKLEDLIMEFLVDVGEDKAKNIIDNLTLNQDTPLTCESLSRLLDHLSARSDLEV